MSGIGRGIGRGLGIARGDAIKRESNESGVENPEVGGGNVLGKGVGIERGNEGIGRGRGKGSILSEKTVAEQIASLDLSSPTEPGQRSTSPEDIPGFLPESPPKSPLTASELMVPHDPDLSPVSQGPLSFLNPPPTPPSGSQQESSDFHGRSVSPPLVAAGFSLGRCPPNLAAGSSKSKRAMTASSCIQMDIEPGKGVIEYHVGFVPDIESVTFRKLAIGKINGLGNIAIFDGTTLLLPWEYKEKRTEISVAHPANPAETVTVEITFVEKKEPKNCVQFYNILFDRIMKTLAIVEMRENFYDVRVTQQIPQHTLEIWPGFCVSVEAEEGGVLLCLDSSHKVLRQETAYDILTRLRDSGAPDWKEKFQVAILDEVVLTRYNKNGYIIEDILWHSRPTDTFPWNDEEISFVDYYKTQYNLNITDYDQPLLSSKLQPKRGVENQEERTVVLIPEFCNMTGLMCEQAHNFQVLKDVEQCSRLTPQQRLNAAHNWIENILASEEAISILEDWGISILSYTTEGGMLQVEESEIKRTNWSFDYR